MRVPAGAGRAPLDRRAGLGDAAGVAAEHGAEGAGGRLRLLDHPLAGIRLEHHDRAGRSAVVGDVGAAHVGADGLVAGEVVGVGERALGVLLRPDHVLQRDVGDVADVPDRRQVGEEVAGHDRLARLPLVLHVVGFPFDAEGGRDLDEVDDLPVVLVGGAVDVAAADVDHHHGVEAADPLLRPHVLDPCRADRALVDEAHPVVTAHVADVVLAGPHHGVLRLAVGRGALRRLELGDRQVPGLQGPGNQVLGDGRYVVAVVDGLDALSRDLERRFHRVWPRITGGHTGIDGQERERAEDDDPLSGPASEGPHAIPPELRR